MRKEEFITEIESMGFGVQEYDENQLVIFDRDTNFSDWAIIAAVNGFCEIDTKWIAYRNLTDEDKEKVFNLFIEYAKTPPDQRKLKLTTSEKTILENLNAKFSWIARDANYDLYIFTHKPKKNSNEWLSIWGVSNLTVFNHLFHWIRWSDAEPVNIHEVLKESED